MAQLIPAEPTPANPWSATQSRAQFSAITWLRWRILLNTFRSKGSAGTVVSWIILTPLFIGVVGALAFAAGAGAAFFTHAGHPERISLILWGIFFVTQLVNIQLGSPGTTFDPTELIRFPISVSRYTAIRLFFGILSPGNIITTLLSLATAIGVLIIRPGLWLSTLLACALFAAVNVIFSRMVFSWVDRWLSTRRAREVFTALIFTLSLAFQWANFTYNPAYHHKDAPPAIDYGVPPASRNPQATAAYNAQQQATAAQLARKRASIDAAHARYNKVKPYLNLLPPGLAGNAIASAAHGQSAAFAAETAGLTLFGAAFLAVFSLRMRTEFRGENLSDQANAVRKPKPTPRVSASTSVPLATPSIKSDPGPWALGPGPSTLNPEPSSSIVSAILAKEFLYLRRNTGLFYGLIAPLVMVFLFAGKMASRSNAAWIFPAALAYALLGVVPISFNSFGLDGVGSHFYFIAPVRMRDILLGKNILNASLAILEIIAILSLVTYVAGMPSPLVALSSVFWALGTLFVELTVGNYQSISNPKRVDPNRTAQKQARPLSALASMGILMASAGIGFALMLLAHTFPQLSWLLPILMLAFAAAGALIYWKNLDSMDNYALQHRETLFEELSKKS